MSTLAEAQIGESVRVIHVAGEDAIGIRLQEMGLTPGVEVALMGVAPLGDPLEFRVRGYRLSLRKREAQRVEVVPA